MIAASLPLKRRGVTLIHLLLCPPFLILSIAPPTPLIDVPNNANAVCADIREKATLQMLPLEPSSPLSQGGPFYLLVSPFTLPARDKRWALPLTALLSCTTQEPGGYCMSTFPSKQQNRDTAC